MNEHAFGILLVEDDEDHADLFRRALEAIEGFDFQLTHVLDVPAARRELARPDLSIIFLDFRLGMESGLDMLRALRAEGEYRPVIVLTGQGNEYIAVEMMRAGATDYLLKADLRPNVLASTLRKAIESLAQGQSEREQTARIAERLEKLTPREREVMELVISGLTTPQIGKHLHRSTNTVKIHRTNLMRKMEASTPAHLARMVTMCRLPVDTTQGEDIYQDQVAIGGSPAIPIPIRRP